MKTRYLLILFLALMAINCGSGTETGNPSDNQDDTADSAPISSDDDSDNQTTLLDNEWEKEEIWEEEE